MNDTRCTNQEPVDISKTLMFAWNIMMMAWFQQNSKLHVRFCDTLWKFCCALASSKAGTIVKVHDRDIHPGETEIFI